MATRRRETVEVLSRDVLGIFYRHREDGRLYAHAFGQDVVVDVKFRGAVMFHVLSEAPPVSGVEMFAVGDRQLVLKHRDGFNLSEDF